MKKRFSNLLIFTFFLLGSNCEAQSNIVIPNFSGEFLYLRVFESVSPISLGGFGNPTLSISDGSEISFSHELKICKSSNELENVKTIASVINQIRKQGYSLFSTTNGAQGIHTSYLFERENAMVPKGNK
jgi:hypothetical protein